MTIERVKGEIVVHCDKCSECVETGATDFQQALSTIRMSGWTYINTKYGWEHFCPECSAAKVFGK